jgi:hypothetical protein
VFVTALQWCLMKSSKIYMAAIPAVPNYHLLGIVRPIYLKKIISLCIKYFHAISIYRDRNLGTIGPLLQQVLCIGVVDYNNIQGFATAILS